MRGPTLPRKGLMTIAEYARQAGLTEATIRGRIQTGLFKLNKHFYKRGRRIMIDYEACQRWEKGKK